MLETFRSRLQLVSETCTQVTFVCPVCGSKNLKINKFSHAYCCFGSGCSSTDIRRHLGIFCRSHLTDHPHLVFPVETSCDNVTFYNQTFARPSVQVFWYNKYQSKASKTIYQYTPVLRMVRVKIWSTQEKFFFPEMLNSENQWVTTRGTTIDFPFYNSMLLPQSDLTLLVTEGEKCAAQLSQDFALTVSPVGFGSNSEKYLRRHIGNLKYSVKNVLYVPDNDAPGKHKADLFQRICWENHLPCSVLRLDYGGDGKDIFDWLTLCPRSKPEIQLFLLGGLCGI